MSKAGDWYAVTLSVPWVVKGVTHPQDAINIAVSEVGRRTDNTKTRNRNIAVQTLACPNCDGQTEAVLMTADMAMVGLMMNVEVSANSPDHSKQVAKREIGQCLEGIPLAATSSTTLETEAAGATRGTGKSD